MPITIAPQEQGIGELLGMGLGQGISSGAQNLIQQLQNKKAITGLQPLFEQLGLEPDKIEMLTKSGLSPDQALSALKIMSDKQKTGQASLEEYGNILDQLEGMYESGEGGQKEYAKSFLPSWMGGGQARQNTALIQSLGTSLLGLAQRIALKQGIRNQKEFQAFMDRTIPNQSDDRDTALGKIRALRDYIKLESKSPQKISQQKDQKESETSQQTVRMRDPKTGQIYPVPADRVEKLKAQGAQVIR